MNQKSNQIVYFGSGNLSAKCLEKLLLWQNVSTLVTKSSTLKDKKNKLLEICNNNNIQIVAVDNKTELEEKINDGSIPSTTLAVLIDFGVIVSQKVIDHFSHGIINSHFSSLPDWRGADPITFSIVDGSNNGIVSLMYVDVGMDTGKIIAKSTFEIKYDDIYNDLEERYITTSDLLMKRYLTWLQNNRTKIESYSQDGIIRYSKKLSKSDGLLDYRKSIDYISREITAYCNWPKSTILTKYGSLIIKRVSTERSMEIRNKIGRLFTFDGKLYIGMVAGALEIIDIQRPGKNPMKSSDYLIGLTALQKSGLEELGVELDLKSEL
jgi:methionyl-tRNA formyltransferase